jgi:acetyl esterase/lipase
MRKVLFISVLCFFSLSVGAQQKMSIWPNDVPGAVKPRQNPVVDLKSEKGVIYVRDVTNPTLEVYMPSRPNNMAVVVCPGGAYQFLAYDKEGIEIAKWLAKQGFTAYVLSYRVPNQRMGALQDVQRSIRMVRESNKAITKVGVIGFSAGGSLSARAATRFNEKTYAAVDAADQLSCRPDFAMLIYPAYLDEGTNFALTPELTMSKDVPPIFIFATEDDPYSNSALVMAQALRYNKTPVEFHFTAVGGHGYGLRAGAGKVWPKYAEKWLKETVIK